MTQPNLEELEATVVRFLDDALGMTLNLSENDSAYSVPFIREKLALCSTYAERLSDIGMKLTKISIEVTKAARDAKALADLQYHELKGSQAYEDQPRERKTLWLQSATKDHQEKAEKWNTLKRVVSDVKDAVGERAQTLNRLNSDLRLHSKLLEMAPQEGRGATSPGSYTGSRAGEIEL